MGLVLENISFAYPGHRVLHDVSCSFDPGQFHVILGPNGSGKTTLLDVMSGFSVPDSGTTALSGVPTTNLSKRALARKVSLVTQDYDIRFPFSVEEIVLMGRHPYIDRFSRPSAKDISKAEEAMALTGISHLRHKRITEISGGERQRSVFARALCQDTPYLLLDEAFANMDIRHTLQLLHLLKQFTEKGEKTVIAVLHDLNLAASWADQLLFLRDGQVFAQNKTQTAFTEANIQSVFEVDSEIAYNPYTQSLQAAFRTVESHEN